MGVAYFVGEWAEQYRNTATAFLINALGGLLPMIPYFIFVQDVQTALFVSIGITAVRKCPSQQLALGYIEAWERQQWPHSARLLGDLLILPARWFSWHLAS